LREEVREMKKISEWMHAVLYLPIVFSAAGVLLLNGCGENPLSPDTEITPEIEILSQENPKIGRVPENPASRGFFIRKIVGPKGGTVHCWHHSLTIPSGAFAKRTWVSISWPNRSFPVLDFSPDGIQFQTDQPMMIRISYKGGVFGNLDEENLHIYQWDTDSDGWVNIGGIVNKKMKYIEVPVTHLSRYALSDR
jgi:hypothetical protein